MGGSRRAAPLNRERVVHAAMSLADASGISALTMRSLARRLGVQPMSLYHHFDNKEAILDAIVDAVFAEIELPVVGAEWRGQMRRRAASLRAALKRHPWALAVMDTRSSPGPVTLRHHDAVIGTLRAAGLSLPMTAHAYATIDAFVYGFALQEVTLPLSSSEDLSEPGEPRLAILQQGYPHLLEFATRHVLRPSYEFGASFEFGLDIILDGLAAHAAAPRPSMQPPR